MTDATAAEGGAKRARKRSRGKHRKRTNEDENDAADDTQEAQGDEEQEEEQAPVREDPPKPKKEAPAPAPGKRIAVSSPALAPPPKQQNTQEGPKLSFYERVNPHKPSAKAIPSSHGSRAYTISIALPGSIVLNAQTPELQARLAGQIARTCAIFNVDEIVVFDEGKSASTELNSGDSMHAYSNHRNGAYGSGRGHHEGDEHGDGEGRSGFDPNAFLARILQYLETPQYLRKALFPMHRDLRLAGLLPPLDCPHHLRFQDRAPYREGVIVDPSSASDYSTNYDADHHSGKKRKRSHGNKVWVNVGLKGAIEVDVPVPTTTSGGAQTAPEIGTRVTVRIPEDGSSPSLVSPRDPTEQAGMYWGYTVRLAPNLGLALSDAPASFEGGYDLLIGTSERGSSLEEVLSPGEAGEDSPMKPFRHAIVVLGGLSGLEDAVERDEVLEAGADDAHALFDVWVNLVEGQGSRTIRTEEALMIALARLKGPLDALGRIEKE
ncbi:unnamed protein product [Tilletia controversa]|uniref:DUF171-domain-containing protein n=3 Tax=Tilletia TaxID=13289 RepID=A0A8X7MZJ6_9BASI|nr:hypothetical protein CF336_g1327 [Tilletia laevis]KAE8202116.1 hypothetical protein CF328_g2401 [Tilletia controversa]KAE8260213.1 hypothetical protein A4X03_0g3880 [Tilletia caries]KAE8208249.1 hypothetical protein CF335_g562 [Tilletia laevis]KAE8253288.1 hypothetical protein A4X06_0g1563 [Tilletia controversa]